MRTFWCIALGGLAGGFTTFVVWKIFSSKIDKQLSTGVTDVLSAVEPELKRTLTAEIDAQVPGLVRQGITSTLNTYGITPTTGRQISSVLATASDWGLI